jgi:hypothetical protein
MHWVNKVAIGAWGVVAACVAIWALETYEPDFSAEYLAVASQDAVGLRLSEVSCVSIDRAEVVFDGKEYADPKLAEAITDVLTIKKVVFDADEATCPWYISITGISGRDYNVMYGNKVARYLVAITICVRHSDPRAASVCNNKNIYVFNRRVEPHKLFLLALVGLARSQTAEWELYQVSKEHL